jgi:uncharacterized membrane protein YraQ (UPF0718 family)
MRDLVLGLLIAGAAGAWIPDSFWQRLFLTGHPLLAKAWGPIIGPAVAVVTFVCSIGNVPLAAVLWNGGISFGGVISFIFADLIIIPLLLIYRKYYGTRMALPGDSRQDARVAGVVDSRPNARDEGAGSWGLVVALALPVVSVSSCAVRAWMAR